MCHIAIFKKNLATHVKKLENKVTTALNSSDLSLDDKIDHYLFFREALAYLSVTNSFDEFKEIKLLAQQCIPFIYQSLYARYFVYKTSINLINSISKQANKNNSSAFFINHVINVITKALKKISSWFFTNQKSSIKRLTND